MVEMRGEFSLIKKYFDVKALTSSHTDDPFFELNIGDDCALVQPSPGTQLAISTDTLVSGVHFLVRSPAYSIGWRCLAVSISDLAAMGAMPKAFTLALTLPDANEIWLDGFSQGLAAAAQHYKVRLIGGDTTKGPLSMTLTVFGEVPIGQALKRSTARVGDDVYVSGYLGGAHFALQTLNLMDLNPAQQSLQEAYFSPSSCIELGIKLRPYATSVIDISDGLVADLGHICEMSRVGIVIEADLLPLHQGGALNSLAERQQAALSGGDDYQLAFTAPVDDRDNILALAEQLGIQLTRIGRVIEGQRVKLEHALVKLKHSGYQHF